MKKFLAFFIIVFSFFGTVSALTSDERFTAAKEKYPDAEKFSPKRAAFLKSIDKQKNNFLYIEAPQLTTQKEALETFFTHNPEKTLIIDFARGDGFVNDEGTITLKKDPIPPPLQNLIISNVQGDITAIGNYFLYRCTNLRTIDLSALVHVTSIGEGFLSECSSLTRIDLSPFTNVTSIGSSFLSSCRGLTHIDLSPLARLTSIGAYFLYDCKKLTNIDISPLSSVTSIGNDFLSECKGLQNIGIDAAFMDRLNEASRKNVVKPLRESNFLALQALGQNFYVKYIYKPDPDLEAALKQWDFEMLKSITLKTDLKEETQLYYNNYLKPIYDMVNAFKSAMFESMVGLKSGSYSYTHMLTAINDTIGLPAAMQNFRERITPASDEEITHILTTYFRAFFTPENLGAYIFEKVREADREKDLKQDKTSLSWIIHDEMAKMSDNPDTMEERTDYEITIDEITRLLKLMGILKENTPAENATAPAGLFVG